MDGARSAAWVRHEHDQPSAVHYEYRLVTFPRSVGRSEVRALLTAEAEYGRWELARTLLYTGGERKVWLRRRIIRMRSTL